MTRRIAVAYGDGIGPEIMKATIDILKSANVDLEFDVIDVGEKVYLSGISSGISPESWNTIKQNKILLKAPITTPQGGGYKSLNVTIRKLLGLFANVRPCISYSPFIKTNFPNLDLIIIRENEEDLYAGIEHRQTPEVYQCLKLLSSPGTENIIRYAFEYAKVNNRKKVTCMTKDNIMKLSDGMFHKVFDKIAKEYPSIESDHMIIDIGSAKLASDPERFDVIVTLNLYGDIISDIAAEVAGSVGLGGSSNVGRDFAMFEAIHGSAPDIAGKGVANPSGLLNGAIMMLNHIGQQGAAVKIHNAWLKTLEDGIHTGDIYSDLYSKKRVGTTEFADAVIERLGQVPDSKPQFFDDTVTEKIIIPQNESVKIEARNLVGVDIFLYWDKSNKNPEILGDALSTSSIEGLRLTMISNRGVKVYPGSADTVFCTDHWRCRFKFDSLNGDKSDLIKLQQSILDSGFEIIKTENLYSFDGVMGFSMGQGE